ncbi:Fmu (Sun) domain-containing protein [Nitritalea halalkaliphila LW7]|uniref:Fmu (Sun) domain-containing protein n=1 Tax=Nitritalea halalkaliphila LW7 TaxID=1189621 RepID=I5BWS1_9BACT|nr:methyltransferase domain-containing protein [Nitritalea halalkaliphila]EIM74023.1 Fmu (Sun) domain-containing protein [Nitritalea halalkaliphila LW7]
MKLFPNTVRGVVFALEQIFEQGYYTDKVIERLFKANPKWGARDRAFVAETVYEMVRWWRLLREISPQQDYYSLFGTYYLMAGHALPAWEEFKHVQADAVRKGLDAVENRAVKASIPDWLDAAGASGLGALWEPELQALNQQAAVVLRVNTLKNSREQLKNRLAADGIQAYAPKGYPDALVLEQRQNIFKHPAFKEGAFEIQDASSQLVAAALDVEPGMRVIDACAGAGGKALHIAALMQNKGRVLAMDIEGWKLKQAKLRARRGGVSILETREIEAKTVKRLRDSADRLLLDVPCTGLGVLKRNPDTKWKLSPQRLEELRGIQQQILQGYTPMLKPGGVLVYATCSILPAENKEQIDRFLASPAGQAFQLVEEQHVLAHQSGFDGFYVAKLQKG